MSGTRRWWDEPEFGGNSLKFVNTLPVMGDVPADGDTAAVGQGIYDGLIFQNQAGVIVYRGVWKEIVKTKLLTVEEADDVATVIGEGRSIKYTLLKPDDGTPAGDVVLISFADNFTIHGFQSVEPY